MKIIKLTNGYETKVSDEDFEFLSRWRWFRNKSGYVQRTEYVTATKRKIICMHRVILNTPKGMVSDHSNHDTLDNTRENLRICTYKQNGANSKKHKNSSNKFKGASLDKRDGRWQAKVARQYIGRFATEEDAAIAYNSHAIKIYGEFARLNIL